MMNWAKQKLADVAGTREPIYGPSAILSVAEQAETTPFTELKKEDFAWNALDTTNVETQVFYLFAESGHSAFVQIIYSNVAGLRTTCQFNTKIFYPRNQNKPNLWSSDQLSHVDFSDDKTSFYADNLALELSADNNTYTIKSLTNDNSIVDLVVTRTAPAFHIGKDGKTLYGTDLSNPWGSMRHAFWPRSNVTGTIVTKDGPIDFKGNALFVMALQGMKPHHAAAKWKFVNFRGPTYSAVLMEFTTPPSYGTTSVNVGAISKDGEIICGSSSNIAEHTESKEDPECDWLEPTAVKFAWKGKTKDGKDVDGLIEGPLDARLDRVDIMAEVPGFIKQIVAGAAGTKPYIYQWQKPIALKLKIGGEEITEEGILYNEATFISA